MFKFFKTEILSGRFDLHEVILLLIVINLLATTIMVVWRFLRFPRGKNIRLDEIPEFLQDAAKKQIDLGYRIAETSPSHVTLVKTRFVLYPWVLMLLGGIPFFVAFGTVSLGELYCLRIFSDGDRVVIETF